MIRRIELCFNHSLRISGQFIGLINPLIVNSSGQDEMDHLNGRLICDYNTANHEVPS